MQNEDHDASEPIYKEYLSPDGEILKITKADFGSIVEWFLWLDDTKRKLDREKPGWNNKTPP